jgi:hypothetical protein
MIAPWHIRIPLSEINQLPARSLNVCSGFGRSSSPKEIDVALGSFGTELSFPHMSAFPLLATGRRTSLEVRFVPATDIDDANQIDEAQKTAPLNLAIQSPLGS